MSRPGIEATNRVSGRGDLRCEDMTARISIGIRPIETYTPVSQHLLMLPLQDHCPLTCPWHGQLMFLESCRGVATICEAVGLHQADLI